MTDEPERKDRGGEEEEATLLRHEETLALGRSFHEIGRVHARKVVDTEAFEETVPKRVEHLELERTAARPDDPGDVETLPDGSFSIPLYGEEAVVSKRVVVRERVRIGKRFVTEPARVEAELRKERIELDADPGVEVDILGEGGDENVAIVDRNVRRADAHTQGSKGWLDKAESRETKPFFLTSEFLVLLAGVGALAGSVAAFDHFDLGRGLMLITALAAAYILSRGLSKAGTSRSRD